MTVIDNLAAAIASLVQSAAQSSSSLAQENVTCEDMPIIEEQVGRAAGTVEELRELLAGGDRDTMFVLLHKLNNQLTGVLALTLLVKDDLSAGHGAIPAFERLDHAARNAAVVVKQLATELKS